MKNRLMGLSADVGVPGCALNGPLLSASFPGGVS